MRVDARQEQPKVGRSVRAQARGAAFGPSFFLSRGHRNNAEPAGRGTGASSALRGGIPEQRMIPGFPREMEEGHFETKERSPP